MVKGQRAKAHDDKKMAKTGHIPASTLMQRLVVKNICPDSLISLLNV